MCERSWLRIVLDEARDMRSKPWPLSDFAEREIARIREQGRAYVREHSERRGR